MTSQEIGGKLHALVAARIVGDFPRLLDELDWTDKGSHFHSRAEWELTVLLAFAVLRAVAATEPEPDRQAEIIGAFLKAAAGSEVREFMKAMQPRLDEYEKALLAGGEEGASRAGRRLLEHLDPGDGGNERREAALARLYRETAKAGQAVLEAA